MKLVAGSEWPTILKECGELAASGYLWRCLESGVEASGGAFFFGKVNRIVELTPFLCGVFSFGDSFGGLRKIFKTVSCYGAHSIGYDVIRNEGAYS